MPDVAYLEVIWELLEFEKHPELLFYDVR